MFLVDCGAPSTSDGYTLGNVGGTTFGQTVSFSCATGYTGNGGEIQCQADQSWSPLSGCVIVSKLLGISISPSYVVPQVCTIHIVKLGETLGLILK